MALYFVPILQSTSSRTFSLIFVFKGQVIYMKDKQIRFVKYGGMEKSVFNNIPDPCYNSM